MTSVEKMIEENEKVLKQIVLLGGKLERPKGEKIHKNRIFTNFLPNFSDRLNLFNWIQVLGYLAVDDQDQNYRSYLKMKHEYLQYLYVTLKGPYKRLASPFNQDPPKQAEDFIPLCECISNKIADLYQDFIPRAGKLEISNCGLKNSLNIC